MSEQLTFSLPVRPALGREDFFVSAANALAVTTLEGWRDWPQLKLVLVGPSGSGKTHLAHVWAENVGARILSAEDLKADVVTLGAQPVVFEDIDRLAASAHEALFHLHNHMQAAGHPLLMTSAIAPNRLGIALADLQSRLGATSIATMEALDDQLLAAILMKLFIDRQINVPGKLLDYVLPRIERSFEGVHSFVATMDARALAEGRPIGKGLAREVLEASLDTDPENPTWL